MPVVRVLITHRILATCNVDHKRRVTAVTKFRGSFGGRPRGKRKPGRAKVCADPQPRKELCSERFYDHSDDRPDQARSPARADRGRCRSGSGDHLAAGRHRVRLGRPADASARLGAGCRHADGHPVDCIPAELPWNAVTAGASQRRSPPGSPSHFASQQAADRKAAKPRWKIMRKLWVVPDYTAGDRGTAPCRPRDERRAGCGQARRQRAHCPLHLRSISPSSRSARGTKRLAGPSNTVSS
jgi:hypothetical protein